jgi:hypothetical protein
MSELQIVKPEATKHRIVKPPILPIFGRTFSLLCALIVCAAAACCWWAKGISWVYDAYSSNITVLSCPRQIYSFRSTVPDGDYCQVSVTKYMDFLSTFSDNTLFGTNKFSCARPIDTSEPIICNLDRRCDASVCHYQSDATKPCQEFAREPPIPVGLTGPICDSLVGFNPVSQAPVWISVPCKTLLIGSYCDSDFKVTSSNAIAIRGLLVGAVLVTLIWFIAEWVLRSVDIDLRLEKATGMARMAIELPGKKQILRQSLEQRWKQAASASLNTTANDTYDDGASSYGWTPRSSFTGGDRVSMAASSVPNDPSRRFGSAQWRRRLEQWKKLRKEKSGTFQTKIFLRTLLLNLFFVALLVGTYYVIILISPQNISIEETWYESVVGKMMIWHLGNWIDYLIFADIFLDTGIFLIACIAVKWPKAPVFSKHLQDQIAQAVLDKADEVEHVVPVEKQLPGDEPPVGIKQLTLDIPNDDTDFDISLSADGTESQLSFILNQTVSIDTCLMIACHCSTMTVERCETFSNTLKSALAVFPPSHIFVCDNGPTIQPQDATQFVAKQVHPDINYLYIPEGNKTFAFYWCNKYWIPFLAKCGVVPNFTYALIIDDDVPLPSDLHIPHEHLRQDTRIKAVHFPITATTPDGNPPLLVNCQDVEYKLAAVHKLFQATMYRSLSCHGAIALWERKSMGEVFHGHDTVFNGEDLYMGITLLRKRDDSKIISSAQTIVPTYAPDNFPVLFRQRVKSWELTSHKKTFTYLVEVINPVSFFHLPSLCLKPYFMQELLTILLDWLRIFLICGLLLRDTLGLLLMTAFFTIMLYLQLLLFQFVILRERRDLRSSFYTILMFPFYKFMSLIFRICALCQNILVYSKERKNLPIKVREDEIRDIPPLPPHHLVDWFSVWEAPEEIVGPMKSLSRTFSRTSNPGAPVPNRFRI